MQSTLRFWWRLLVICLAFNALGAKGQDPPVEIPPSFPPVTDGKKLEGQALMLALQKGGFVLYLRHSETGPGPDDCSQSNLTERGREQAKAIGDALRALKIPIGQVISSEMCRALETAKLVSVGMVTINEDLHRMPKRPDHKFHEGRAKLIAAAPAAGTNTLLVGHMQYGNGQDQRLFMQLGEIIVFRPQSGGSPDVVAHVRSEDWTKLRQVK